jgi:diguanylate cyclase (GGDEF)-like protein
LTARFTVILSLVLALLLALGGATLAVQYRQAVIAAKQDELRHLELGLLASLHTLMNTGKAGLIQDWLGEVRNHRGLERVTILGRDGEPAFRDLDTLRRVNDHLDQRSFQRAPRPQAAPPPLAQPRFRQALAGDRTTHVDWASDRMVRLLPLKQAPSCRGCHGYTDAETLGVLRLSSTLSEARERVHGAYLESAGFAAMVVLLTGLAAFLLVRREILHPLHRIMTTARRWRDGGLDARVPDRPADEIGTLGRILNDMAGRLERQLHETRNLIAQSRTGMVVIDAEGTILFANPAAARLMNRPRAQLTGSQLGVPLVDGHKTEIQIRRGNGESGVAELSVHATEWDGQPAHLVTFHDVTERQQAEADARHRALHDALTGLPNRVRFHDLLERAIVRAAAQGNRLAVLFIDLDRFKEVNDTLGHAAGDELLRAVARRLREAVRDTDVVARMSGDEFTVLLDGIGDRDKALDVAEKVRRRLAEPAELSSQTLNPVATIGVSLFPEDGEDADTLLMRADTAMYHAKEAGRNCAHAFAADQGEAASRRFRLEKALQRAQANDEFRLFYQPQVGLPGGEWKGMEALLRWEDPIDGLVSPADFIPLLEETGMIHEVGEWVFRRAAADLRRWREAGQAVGRVWVNVSARQLATDDLVARLDRLIREDGLAPEQVGIELTESGVAGDIAHSVAVLDRLRQRGFQIAMDDFGTGYSALTFLRQLPIDEVKIDRAFVHGITENREDHHLIRAIIAMAHGLGLPVLAEGVETADQAELLAAEGCDAAQGFYYARPGPADELTRLRPEAGPGLPGTQQEQ